MSISDRWDDGELYKELAELKIENAELRKDKERLDWLLENVICTYQRSWHPRDAEYLATREDIDEAMGGAE
jgi:hypothetical protein